VCVWFGMCGGVGLVGGVWGWGGGGVVWWGGGGGGWGGGLKSDGDCGSCEHSPKSSRGVQGTCHPRLENSNLVYLDK